DALEHQPDAQRELPVPVAIRGTRPCGRDEIVRLEAHVVNLLDRGGEREEDRPCLLAQAMRIREARGQVPEPRAVDVEEQDRRTLRAHREPSAVPAAPAIRRKMRSAPKSGASPADHGSTGALR